MIAEHLSSSRTIKDSTELFMDARKRAIKKPKKIFADGCFAYRKGSTKPFTLKVEKELNSSKMSE